MMTELQSTPTFPNHEEKPAKEILRGDWLMVAEWSTARSAAKKS